jgi:hypothetical protein
MEATGSGKAVGLLNPQAHLGRMTEYHNVGKVDVGVRLVLAVGALALVRWIVLSDPNRALVAFLVVMPVFAYLVISALIREDALYVLWDIDTRQKRGHRWSGHHGDVESHFESPR